MGTTGDYLQLALLEIWANYVDLEKSIKQDTKNKHIKWE